jgi:hypothetical protein
MRAGLRLRTRATHTFVVPVSNWPSRSARTRAHAQVANVGEVLLLLQRCSHDCFPVVDGRSRLRGTVLRKTLTQLLAGGAYAPPGGPPPREVLAGSLARGRGLARVVDCCYFFIRRAVPAAARAVARSRSVAAGELLGAGKRLSALHRRIFARRVR